MSQSDRLPVGVCLRAIGATPAWWLESARRLDEAGYAGIWSWDHFAGRPDPRLPVVEAWTILTLAADRTSHAMVGTFVLNVMNRHPAVLARMASTLQIASGGRLILGIGVGGAPEEHLAYGIEFPAIGERVARLRDAVTVLRALWNGQSVTVDSPFYPLREAVGLPAPDPPPPILIGGQTATGARLAAEIGDGWTAFDTNFERNLPTYLDELARQGRSREDQLVLVGFEGDPLAEEAIAETAWVRSPREEWARWHAAGADGAVVLARTTADVDALVDAVARW